MAASNKSNVTFPTIESKNIPKGDEEYEESPSDAFIGKSSARTQAECKEFFDDPEVLEQKIKTLAQIIRNSKHMCAFTGAGISTAAGIADFRSGINTVLDTGAGKWAANAAKKSGKSKSDIKQNKKPVKCIKAYPTASHMALVSLTTLGPKYLKYLISQNTDGLHRRSGIPVDQLSELHGNRTLEVCDKCGKAYMRDFTCRKSLRKQKCHDHFTGRYCSIPSCRGKLHDTVINFGEILPEEPLKKGEENAEKCDVMLAMGSSLCVTPAADLPKEVGDRWSEEMRKGIKRENCKHHLIIVNLQRTPLDDVCSLRIFAKIDDVMVPLMKELGLEIPEWKLQRFMKVKVDPMEDQKNKKKVTISAVEVDGLMVHIFKKVKLRYNGTKVPGVSKRNFIGDSKKKALFEAAKGLEFPFNVSTEMMVPEPLQLDIESIDEEEVKEEALNDQTSKKNETLLSPVYKRPKDDVSPNPYHQNETASNDDDNDDEKEMEIPSNGLVAEIEFLGNYSESKCHIPLSSFLKDLKSSKSESVKGLNGDSAKMDIEEDIEGEFVCRLLMDPKTKKWSVEAMDMKDLSTKVKDCRGLVGKVSK